MKLRIVCETFVAAIVLCGTPALAQPEYSPAWDAETTLSTPFVWKDGPQFTSYSFLVMRADTGLIVHSATIPGSGAICPSDSTCTLTPGVSAYPALETRDYKWAVLGRNSVTGISEWWDPAAFSPFHPLPNDVAAVVANWVGNAVNLDWPAATGAASYHAAFMNWATVTSSETYFCSGPACSGTADVTQIPFGTVEVRLRSCGINGHCTAGVTTEAYKSCPDLMAEPALITPSEGAVVKGLTSVRWSEPSAAERYFIQFQKDTGAPFLTTTKQEVVWRSEVSCKPNGGGLLCERAYGLAPGSYLALLSAACGGQWGPQKVVAFTVEPAPPVVLVSPKVLSPQDGATTSIHPVILWAKVPDVESYELVVAAAPPAIGASKSHIVTCKVPVCAFDYASEGDFAVGDFTFAVRINEDQMPFSDTRTFTASLAYRPTAVEQTSPFDLQQIGDATKVAVQFNADVQVPFSFATIAGPGGYFVTSPTIARASPLCQYVLTNASGGGLGSAGIINSCVYTSDPLGAPGLYNATVAAASQSNEAGTAMALTPGGDFRFIRVSGQSRDIYTVFAQNTQFLPASGPFGHVGGASSAWGLSDRARALKLQEYVNKNQFDVVVLSEVFVSEAQEELQKLLSPSYPYYAGKIDTAGIASIDEAFAEQDSGLAIYSKFAPEFVAPGSTSNYQCTSDTFNEIDEGNSDLAAFDLNDYMWFKQFCKAEGNDALTAKGIAGVRLLNPRTGAPLLIAFAHSQATTDDETDSYDARGHQLQDDARPAVEAMVATMPPVYDAFVLGDWNVNQPQSVGRAPKFGGNNTQSNFGGILADMYSLSSVDTPDASPDPKNPLLESLVPKPPEEGDGPKKTLYQQYRLFLDPRTAGRAFPGFYDLWLENPAGDPGLTFDVTGRRSVIACTEWERETCGNRYPATDPRFGFDSGSRYDTVMARFSASNIRNAPGGSIYPTPSPAWLEKRSCVQSLTLARDFAYSDHFGTIIEVGPEEPLCNPMEAKADPHLWREPNSLPLPDPNKPGYDPEAGIHRGKFRHGGASEWFVVNDAGAFDLIIEQKDPSMDGIIVEAFLPTDISTPIPVADSKQHVDGFLPGDPGCNQEINDAAIRDPDPRVGGTIAEPCGTPDARVTYRSPGQLYFRITPAKLVDPVNQPGVARRCTDCIGDYQVRFRKRTCRKPIEAVAVSSGIFNFGLATKEQGWFGAGQEACWFQVELQKPSSDADFQTLTITNVGSMNGQTCNDAALSGGNCSGAYDVNLFKNKADADADGPILWNFSQPSALFAGGISSTTTVAADWDLVPEEDTGRKAYYVRVRRDDSSRPHASFLPWDTNLKSVVFQAISTTNIEDDYLFTIPNPFGDDIQISDPFNNTDELRIRQFVNGHQLSFVDYDLNVDNAGNDTYRFPDMWPDFPKAGIDGKPRVYGGRWPSDNNRGTWLNYTGAARVEATEMDDFSAFDWVVADNVMCGRSGAAPADGWQADWFLQQWNSLPGQTVRSASKVWTFDDECAGDPGDPTWHYEFKAGVDRTQ